MSYEISLNNGTEMFESLLILIDNYCMCIYYALLKEGGKALNLFEKRTITDLSSSQVFS